MEAGNDSLSLFLGRHRLGAQITGEAPTSAAEATFAGACGEVAPRSFKAVFF